MNCNAPCDHSVEGTCNYRSLWSRVIDEMIRDPREKVLHMYLFYDGPQTRPELVRSSKFPRSTIYDILQRMISQGYIGTNYEQRSKTGRPMTVYYLKDLAKSIV